MSTDEACLADRTSQNRRTGVQNRVCNGSGLNKAPRTRQRLISLLIIQQTVGNTKSCRKSSDLSQIRQRTPETSEAVANTPRQPNTSATYQPCVVEGALNKFFSVVWLLRFVGPLQVEGARVCSHGCMDLDCTSSASALNLVHLSPPFSILTPACRSWYKVKGPVSSVTHAWLKAVATCWYEKIPELCCICLSGAAFVLCDRALNAGSSVCTCGESRRAALVPEAGDTTTSMLLSRAPPGRIVSLPTVSRALNRLIPSVE